MRKKKMLIEKYLAEKEKELNELKNDASANNKKLNKDVEKEYLQKIEYRIFL